jgi:hypothetical protein
MELRAPTETIDDPFFAAVRRRHPDVDVVLLPPMPPPGPVTDQVADDEVAAALTLVATEADQLWSTVAPGAPERPETRCGFGDDPSSVRAVARVVARRGDGVEVLVRLRRELERRGGGLDVTTSYAEGSGALLLTVSSPSMPVGVERARVLTSPRGGRGGER